LAVERPDWLVAAILPLTLELYLEDWTVLGQAGGAASCAGIEATAARHRLERLLAHPKVKICPLPPLRNPLTGEPRSVEELRVAGDPLNPLRLQHYEQLGLWIARTATLLIAVVPKDEEPSQPGGTARVVTYRLQGRPDALAREVMRASDAVCEPLPLDIAGLGPLWLIDAPKTNGGSPSPGNAFEVRMPTDEQRAIGAPPFARQLRMSLTVARGFNRLAALTRRSKAEFGWQDAPGQAGAAITAIHTEIDRIQGRHKNALIWSSYALAVLFWSAVATYGYTELTSGPASNLHALGLLVYLVLVAGAVVWHWVVGHQRWQRLAEDYRGVNEALRVQRAWWYAGLAGPAYHTDRYYLAQAQQPLLYLRQAVRNITGWVLLKTLPASPAADWHRVYEKNNLKSWLGEQLAYFKNRANRLEKFILRSQMLTWELFFSAQFLAAWLFIDIITGKWLPQMVDHLLWWWGSGFVRGGIFVVLAGAFWLLRHLPTRRAAPRRHWTAAFAVAVALLIGPGVHFLATALAPGVANADHLAIAMAVVLFSAAAVSVRFVAEKLVWEAEAHRYEDALRLFERAETELAAIDRENGPGAEALKRKQEIVFALGKAALEENEYWLRAHRERPIEQAVG
jgi:hypothetical protein